MTNDEEIDLQAYLIWRREGCPTGNDLKYWLRAKREIEAEREATHRLANFFR